ncbi:MAG: NAD(P)-binding protein, partial [Deltaproteobacteria bacterium]|nr:NAD(P)-binding protein [Deltaproteobacteria bacterium]
MASRKVIIIGGGVAGLSLGCYLRMNGYETEVLEQSAAAGGVCAAWTRKGYTFDGATEWLPG